MLTPYKIADYCKEYLPEWTCAMPDGCPPDDVLVPSEHPFFRLAKQADAYSEADFKTYAEVCPERHWGEQLPLAVGLSLIDSEAKARRRSALPLALARISSFPCSANTRASSPSC